MKVETQQLVSLRRVSYVYDAGTAFARMALAGIDLDVAAGDIVAVVGPSGAGKTTLLQLVAGIVRPTEGTVVRPPAAENRVGCAMVFERPESQLFSSTVYDDVAAGPRALGLHGQETGRRVEQALEGVGLSPGEFGRRNPFALSMGQQRMVAVAGVLAVEPRVLCVDEVGAGLDPGLRRALQDALIKWVRGCSDRRLVYSTHDPDEAVYAERVVLLSGGRVASEGPPAAVLGDVELLRKVGLDPPLAARVAAAAGAASPCPTTAASLLSWMCGRTAAL